MSKVKGIPDYIDAPSGNYFAVGTPSLERPFEGSDKLKIIKQDFCSISGDFPAYGEAHPNNSSYSLFYLSPEEHLGGGLLKATAFYCLISGEITKQIRQSVNFYGVRNRQVTFTENYEDTNRSTRFVEQVINGTLFRYEVVNLQPVTKTRDLKAYEIVAREPFSEECICTQHISFYNTAKTPIGNIEKKEKLLVKDSNNANWVKSVKDSYENQKHERSTGFNNPAIPTQFTQAVGTNYLSETSTPSASWYAGKLGSEGYIVQPTNIEPYFAGALVKVDYITTTFR